MAPKNPRARGNAGTFQICRFCQDLRAECADLGHSRQHRRQEHGQMVGICRLTPPVLTVGTSTVRARTSTVRARTLTSTARASTFMARNPTGHELRLSGHELRRVSHEVRPGKFLSESSAGKVPTQNAAFRHMFSDSHFRHRQESVVLAASEVENLAEKCDQATSATRGP